MQHIIIRLQQYVAGVPSELCRFSPEEMTQRPAPAKWSKREILGHLCDSALYNWQRFTAAQRQLEPLKIISYPQDDLVRLNGYQLQPTGEIAALWAAMNTRIVAVLKNLPEEKLAHPVVLPDGTATTLQALIEDYLVHLEHHLDQIFKEKLPAATLPKRWQFSVDAAMAALAKHPQGKPFITLLEQGTMYVEIYQPKSKDLQTPHDQDEIYVVISGSGTFFNNGERRPFGPGDLIFVPAGVEHRFEDFTEDFKTWVIFS